MYSRLRFGLAGAVALVLAACTETDRVTAPDAERGPAFSERGPGAGEGPGVVYAATNAAPGNEVLAFRRAADGMLAAPRTFPTGGRGTGGGLGNQGGLVLGRAGRLLLVVNAGSDDVSLFGVREGSLVLLDRVPSGGTRPVSIAVAERRGLVYVLNAGGAGNISGFTLTGDRLVPLAGSTQPLSGPASGPAQVSFDRDERLLVVTEKATNLISTYVVGSDGLATGPTSQPSTGATPFGFAFGTGGTLVVSEAFGGGADASALSSYRVGPGGTLRVVSPSIGTTETAACWVVITRDGRFAYTSNTGSGTITGYALGRDGGLTILDADGVTATTAPGPIDLALSRNSRFLYSLDGAAGAISAFRVEGDGSLTPIPGAPGLPAGANGLASR